ncbi:MAG: hypothetical protein LC800_10120, partial [Acidobacteria bacterium]|nr:hypothetical protein [Acidobacteriota bacterium]
YDWQGRPTASTNADGSAGPEVTYGGCGCAGGAVVTVTDAVGRKQKSYSDALGRAVKTEVFNGDAVYTSTTTDYNALDQTTRIFVKDEANGVGQETLLTYDGHGRLASGKSPIQTRPTTYQYNSDDTTWKVFTPREPAGGTAQDVVTTFTYNGRRQVTRVGYDVPAGLTNTVRAAATVEAGYDAAGNRLWMIDGMGRADYQYDALSRLQSETRQFTGLGDTLFPLAYTYDLTGAIKSVRDKWGVQVDYDYDAAGSLSSVTGSGYGGVQTYAQNAQYRASGAIKSLAYGNGAHLSLGYTGRMEVSNYKLTVPGAQTTTAMDVDYGYGADGLLRDSTDRTDATLRRAYGYDHAGRLAAAYTGSEANTWVQTNGASTGTVVDGPYRQSYAYDAWDNRTSKFVRAFTGTYTRQQTVNYTLNGATGRNTAWDYDAGGLVTAGDGVSNFYDAAGRLREVSSDAGGTQFEYDGDGEIVKKLGGETIYYLRSSVLGQTVAQVASDGSRGTGFVYAGGELVATQVGGGAVTWQHREASGASRRTTDEAGAVVGRDEVDPAGVTVERPDTTQPMYRG